VRRPVVVALECCGHPGTGARQITAFSSTLGSSVKYVYLCQSFLYYYNYTSNTILKVDYSVFSSRIVENFSSSRPILNGTNKKEVTKKTTEFLLSLVIPFLAFLLSVQQVEVSPILAGGRG
jgi:hypothetical protein